MFGNTNIWQRTPLPELHRHHMKNNNDAPKDPSLFTPSRSPSHPAEFDGLFNTGEFEASRSEQMDPKVFLPFSQTEVYDILIQCPMIRPVKPETSARLMTSLAEGPPFSKIIHTAVHVPATKRCNVHPCFDSKGGLRAPWRYILPGTIKEERRKNEMRSSDVNKGNQVLDDASSNKQEQHDILVSQSKPIWDQRSILPIPSDAHLCQTCQSAPVAHGSRDTSLCASCAALVGASMPRKPGKKINYKKPKAGVDTKLTQVSSSTLQVELDGRKDISGSKPFESSGRRDFSPQSPDPLAQASSPPQRRGTAHPKAKIILRNTRFSPQTIPESQTSLTPSPIVHETPNKKIKRGNEGDVESSISVECVACGMTACICSQPRRHSRTIICSSPTCSQGQFGTGLLHQTWNIDMKDAQEHLRVHGSWFCPSCEQRHVDEQQIQSPVPSASIRNNPLFGESWLDHEDKICRPLDELAGILSQYTAMACGQPFRVAFLDLPCIRHETVDNPSAIVLRQLLDIYDGVSIRGYIDTLHVEPSTSSWINGVSMLLIKQFIFKSGSPFENTAYLREALSDTGLSSDMIDMMVQDIRYRIMKAAGTEGNPTTIQNTKEFTERQTSRDNAFVKQLNNVMFPFLGNNGEINQFHLDITKIASLLNINMSAYRGEYAPIYPKLEDAFDPKFHLLDDSELENPGLNLQGLKGERILFTTMVGVKYKAPGREWIVCSRAKVRMLRSNMPVVENGSTPQVILPQNKRKASHITVEE